MAASTIIGSMTVNVNANTREFAKSMKKMRSLTQTGVKHLKLLGLAITGLGSYASLRGLQNVARELDKLAKTSDKLGIASEKLAGLQHAANVTGVTTETFNMALQRMTRRVAEAAKGTGEAQGALKELGISAEDLMKLSLDEQFSVIATKMALVTRQADKVRLSMKLFDSEGVALVNTLKLGSIGLQEMQKEAEMLGIAIDRKALASVERMNDAMDALQKAFGGMANQLVIALAPGTEEVIRGVLIAYKEQKEGTAGKGGYFSPEFKAGVKSAFGPAAEWAKRNSSIYKYGVRMANKTFGDAAMSDAGVSGELDRFTRGGIDVRNPFSSRGNEVNAATTNASIKKRNKDFIVDLSQQIGKGLVTGNGVIAGARNNAAGLAGAFGTAAARIAGKVLSPYGADDPNAAQLYRSSSNILERGTSEARAALRENLNKTDDKQLELAKKAQEHRVELIEAVKQIFVPSVASI